MKMIKVDPMVIMAMIGIFGMAMVARIGRRAKKVGAEAVQASRDINAETDESIYQNISELATCGVLSEDAIILTIKGWHKHRDERFERYLDWALANNSLIFSKDISYDAFKKEMEL